MTISYAPGRLSARSEKGSEKAYGAKSILVEIDGEDLNERFDDTSFL